jgi:hypothetical protein
MTTQQKHFSPGAEERWLDTHSRNDGTAQGRLEESG